MKAILTIGFYDLKVILRDKSAYIWLFVVPLAFVYFTSFSSRPPREARDARPPLQVENLDEGFMGDLVIDILGNQGVRTVTPEKNPNANPKKGLRIPADFSERVLDKKEVKLVFFEITGEESNPNDLLVELIEANLLRTVITFNGYLLEHATNVGNRPISESALRKLIGKEDPVALDSSFAGRKPIPVGFNMSLPGIMVMYLLMNLLIFGGSSIATARRSGGLRRLSIQPVNALQIVFGKLYGLMLLGVVQISGYLLAGQFLFKVNVGDQLFAIALTLLIFAWVSASLGMLIGFLIKSDDKVVGLAIMISLPLAALGGCWWPMEVVPETFRIIAHVSPCAWAMDSLHQLITFGSGLQNVIFPLSVLAAYGLLTNILAAKFFRI